MASPQGRAVSHHWIANSDTQLPSTAMITCCDQLAATTSRTLAVLLAIP